MIIRNIWKNKSHVPNHQPAYFSQLLMLKPPARPCLPQAKTRRLYAMQPWPAAPAHKGGVPVNAAWPPAVVIYVGMVHDV